MTLQSDFLVWLYNQAYCRLIGTVLPSHWFGPRAPTTDQLTLPEGRFTLEIVSHCWQYAHLSVYQLSSIVNHPPEQLDLHYTLFYCEEDEATVRLVEAFDKISVPNVSWNWRSLPRNVMFRRAIGRNLAALETNAHYIWFADCDLIFHAGCLDSVAASLNKQVMRLAFPASEQITDLLPADHAIVNLPTQNPEPVDIDPDMFTDNPITKAKGAFQIVHGDVARTCGYCRDLSFYQKPTDRWRKTYEDTAFRRVIGDEGTPIPVLGLHRIRHQSKGRYAKDSSISRFRQNLRVSQEDTVNIRDTDRTGS